MFGWWRNGTLVLAGLTLSLLTAEGGMKPAGWGLLTALGLVAGTDCFATHLIAAKPRTPKP